MAAHLMYGQMRRLCGRGHLSSSPSTAVVPGLAEGRSPGTITPGVSDQSPPGSIDSGLAASRRPGMTAAVCGTLGHLSVNVICAGRVISSVTFQTTVAGQEFTAIYGIYAVATQ